MITLLFENVRHIVDVVSQLGVQVILISLLTIATFLIFLDVFKLILK